jgi:hypothetical protein
MNRTFLFNIPILKQQNTTTFIELKTEENFRIHNK